MWLYTQAVLFLLVFVVVDCGIEALETSGFDSESVSWNWELSRAERVVGVGEGACERPADDVADVAVEGQEGDELRSYKRRDWVLAF